MRSDTERRQIKAALVLAGLTNNAIAKTLQVSRQAVSKVIAGQGRSHRIEQALIEIGIPADLFREAKRPGRPRT